MGPSSARRFPWTRRFKRTCGSNRLEFEPPVSEDEIRAAALQFAKDLQGKGIAMDVVAKRLGIAAATLYCWRGSSAPRQMVRVKVARVEPHAVTSHVQLVSPRGYRIEGLPMKVAIAMLQELG